MSSIRRAVVFLGAPGVGKGTYAKLLGPKLGLQHVSTGDLIRAERKQGTTLGKELSSYLDAGTLVPDDAVNRLVVSALDRSPALLLDGYPRTLDQAKFLDESKTQVLVININLPYEHLVAKIMGRITCEKCGQGFNGKHVNDPTRGIEMPPLLPKSGSTDTCDCGGCLVRRSDDTEEVLKQRLEEYSLKTLPLVDYYKKDGRLVDFHVKLGIKDMPRLYNDITTALDTQKSKL